MIGAEQIKLMKPAARLINCARGGIINENDICDALDKKRLAGVALDVYTKEPPENTCFMKFEHCVVTPHLGASTEEAQIDVAVEAARIIVDAIKGVCVKNAVNAPSFIGALSPTVGRYAALAGRIGTLLATITPGHVKDLEIQYRGTIAEMQVEPVTLSFTIGLLQKHFDMPLNMVNTPVLAKERGISINEIKNTAPKDVSASISAKVVTDRTTRTVTGTVFGETLLRIIEIDGFNVEMTPTGTVLIIFNEDKPGVIGNVGTICGRHNINICTMGVGDKAAEQKAILAVSLDKQPDQKIIDEINALEFVNELYVCRLD
jgi:D-3-phosphoglycerate dehydrogenase